MPDGYTPIARGTYLSDEWRNEFGLVITADGEGSQAFTPVKPGSTNLTQVRIFDTSNPGSWANGDLDLGSPNAHCPGGGVGKGDGGKPNQLGENCIPQGNILIIQEEDKTVPDDNKGGGNITFHFDEPVRFDRVGVMDIDEDNSEVEVHFQDGTTLMIAYKGFGNNAVQTVEINQSDVVKVVVILSGSGAVTFLDFCVVPCPETVKDPLPPFDCEYETNTKQQCLYSSNDFNGVDSDPFSQYVETPNQYDPDSSLCDPLNWNIVFSERMYSPLEDTTTFVYTVSNLKDNAGSSKDISHTVIGWTGTCCVVGASYFGNPSSIKPAGPSNRDPSTGVVGVKFDSGWNSCPRNLSGDRVSEHKIVMSGDVPVASDATRASIKGGNGYCLYLLDGPSCPC